MQVRLADVAEDRVHDFSGSDDFGSVLYVLSSPHHYLLLNTYIPPIVYLDIAVVIGRYVEQLYDEHSEYKHGEYKLAKNVGASASTYEPTYYPPTAQDNQGLLHGPASGAYPYTDSAHAFGGRA